MINYIVNKDTLMLISEDNNGVIYTKDGKIVINKLPTDIIKTSCLYYGSTLEGRMKFTKDVLGVTYKCPIVVSETDNLIMFPTSCYKDKNCCWICFNQILNYYMLDKYKIKLIFKNNNEILIDLPIGTLEKQILRSSRLFAILNSRKQQNLV